MNKLAHAVILLWVGAACWLLWALLQLPRLVRLRTGEFALPAFTRFSMAIGPGVVAGLAGLALAYCIWVWCRKGEARQAWVGFLAASTAVLILVTLSVIVAIYLPLVGALEQLAAR
jgi:hypothetical protein